MTLLDYANWVPLPAALGAAAPLTSFTAPDGEVWVAKGGVNGGQWRKARDVLRVKACRQAAYNLGTAAVAMPWDLSIYDDYGLRSGSNFTAPIAGWWRMHTQVGAAATASGQYQAGTIVFGSSTAVRTNQYMFAATNFYMHMSGIFRCNAGDVCYSTQYASAAMVMVPTSYDSYAEFEYLGSYT